MNARWTAAALVFCSLLPIASMAAEVSGEPVVLYPRQNTTYPNSENVVLVLKMAKVSVKDCRKWRFRAWLERINKPPAKYYRHWIPTAWNSSGVVNVGTEEVRATGCIASKRIEVIPGKYSLKVDAVNESDAALRHHEELVYFIAHEVRKAPVPDREAARAMRPRPGVVQREAVRVPDDQARTPSRPDVRQVQRRPSTSGAAPSTDQLRRPAKLPAGTTTLEVLSDPASYTWGTTMTIHHVQKVKFRWSTSVPGVASAEWQVWDQNPSGRSVPPTAKLATGTLPVAFNLSNFTINFDTLLPEYPPAPPATRDYWVSIETRNAQNKAVGTIARPVKISYKGCAASSDCQALHYCDQQTHSCQKIEQFCVKDREIPGYKGTGYSKAAPGTTTRMHLQATDGTSVSCIPYGCKVELDGSARCLRICESTADCAGGFYCSSAGQCVK